MTRKQALQMAKQCWPAQTPHVAAGFSLVGGEHGDVVLVSLHKSDSVLVLHHNTDLWRLKGLIDSLLQRRGQDTTPARDDALLSPCAKRKK
jgi:hypothetical protein